MTIVESDSKESFSIATTPRCKGGRYSSSSIFPFALNTFIIMLRVKQSFKYHFLSIWYDSTTATGKHSNHKVNM